MPGTALTQAVLVASLHQTQAEGYCHQITSSIQPQFQGRARRCRAMRCTGSGVRMAYCRAIYAAQYLACGQSTCCSAALLEGALCAAALGTAGPRAAAAVAGRGAGGVSPRALPDVPGPAHARLHPARCPARTPTVPSHGSASLQGSGRVDRRCVQGLLGSTHFAVAHVPRLKIWQGGISLCLAYTNRQVAGC